MEPILTDFDGTKQRGFAAFNDYPHLCVEVPAGGFTISCQTPDRKHITFAFVPSMPGRGDDYECIDIHWDDAPGEPVMNGGRPRPSFHMLGFTPGTFTFDTRKITPPTTLATLLLGKRHYQR